MDIIISILIAGAAGWFAGRLMKGEYSALINIILGLIGGVVGAFIFELLGFENVFLLFLICINSVIKIFHLLALSRDDWSESPW